MSSYPTAYVDPCQYLPLQLMKAWFVMVLCNEIARLIHLFEQSSLNYGTCKCICLNVSISVVPFGNGSTLMMVEDLEEKLALWSKTEL